MDKMKSALWMSIATLILPMTAFAGGQVNRATIVNMAINKSYGNFVFIQTSITPTGAAVCANSSWQFTLSLSNPGDSQLYAMLLTAYASGALVNITGTGACSEYPTVESVQGVQLTQ
jgi:hypothetical protein